MELLKRLGRLYKQGNAGETVKENAVNCSIGGF